MRLQYTQPPNGSLSGVPSASTSARLAPDADSPRSPAPCVVGLEDLDVVRRNRLKPGVVFNASSNGAGGSEARSAAVRIAIGAAGDVRPLSVREAVTTTDSAGRGGEHDAKGHRPSSAPAGRAKPACLDLDPITQGRAHASSKLPLSLLTVRQSTPLARAVTVAPASTAPESSTTTPRTAVGAVP